MKDFKTLFVFFVLVCSGSAYAAKVTQVKNKKVMISLDGTSASNGSEFFVLNASGKKVAIVRVTQVKGGKAIADITKGTAQAGYSLQAKGGGGGSSSSSSSGSGDSYYDRKLNNRANTGNSFGLVGGYLMNSMTATFPGGPQGATYKVNASMSGSGFGALGYYDYAMSPRFSLRGMGGLEQYNVAGSIATADCNLTTSCSVNLTYLSLYGYGRFNVTTSGNKFWLGGGYGYLYAMSKASNVLKADQITANQIFVLAAGMDFRLSAKTFIPVSLEYGLYPTSDSVKATIMYLRAGYAWNL
ncbi:MAG: hypothetical protein EOP09_03830 [Proteobacteria bacterium]|nr:MAG: hypothetical protein EOP09_03830 [Pseudomonadota bacterium]